jgi:hypothetical protein
VVWRGLGRVGGRGPRRRKDRGEDAAGWSGFVGAYWVSYGPGVVLVWDPFCASNRGNEGFSSGKVGFDFFIFWRWGVARKWSWMRIGGWDWAIFDFERK